MTKAVFTYNDNLPKRFTVNGHANYHHFGTDIVCSAITTAVFTSLNLLNSYDQAAIILDQDEASAIIDCQIIKNDSFIDLIIANLIDVLTNIAQQYPHNLKVLKK